MTVYVIRRKGDMSGLVKIGFTNDIEKRLSSMLTAAPEGLEVIYAIDGDRNLEKTIHAKFSHNRRAREWFDLTDEEIASIPSIGSELVREYKDRHIPSPADEASENIVFETRFYLNELVKREWRGIGDGVNDAITRVMTECQLEPSYGFRLWQKYHDMKDVSGEAYRCLRLSYAMKLHQEGRLNENQERFLRSMARTYRDNPDLRNIEGFGVEYVVGLIGKYFPARTA